MARYVASPRTILIGLRHLFLEPGGRVDHVAEHGELAPLRRPDIADERGPGVDGNPHAHGRSTAGGVEARERRAHVERRSHAPHGMIGLRQRSPEHREHRVADELVERPLALEDDVGHCAEEGVEEVGDLGGHHPLGQRREADDVGEEHGHLALGRDERALGLVAALEDAFDDGGRVVALEALAPLRLLEQAAREPGLLDGNRRVVPERGDQARDPRT